jgi:hypothetical protein
MFIKIKNIVIQSDDIVAIGPATNENGDNWEKTLVITISSTATGGAWTLWEVVYDTPEGMLSDLQKVQVQLENTYNS